MSSILGVILPVSLIAHAALVGFLQFNRRPTRLRPIWLQSAVLWSMLATVLLLYRGTLPMSQGLLQAVALVVMFVCYGQYALRDLLRGGMLLLALGIVWLLALFAGSAATPASYVGDAGWLMTVFVRVDLAGIALLGGLGVTTIYLLAGAFHSFYSARLPEFANRALFWVLNTTAMAVGILLLISGSDVYRIVGELLVLAALAGAAYGHVSHRVYNIRRSTAAAVRTTLLLALGAMVVLAVLLAADRLAVDTAEEHSLALLILAALAATVYGVLRQLIDFLLRPLFRPAFNPARAARLFSQRISRVVELNDLIETATDTLNHVMQVRQSGLMLVEHIDADAGRVDVVVHRPGGGSLPGSFVQSSPIYEQLAVRRLPMSQFDLSYGPRFRTVGANERDFFEALHMSAYAPVIVDDALAGVLMCGPKLHDAPLDEADLEVLAALADQTGVALRNSRAMAALRQLNTTMQILNQDLEEANQQYEKLDSVKTDFVTIASHELRTPLAQIRGYTDILDTLNDQGMLDQSQVEAMVDNLRRAAERTEELLEAMLDVSQLDVNAMDLRFAEAAPESVIRMAIEPLTEQIRRRRLTLSARGLRSLPAIYCDSQRLVQAFRNIVTNAIKFTPDGGRIDITGNVQPGEDGDVDHILVVISDNGVGIKPDDLELIFEKFYRGYDPSLHSTGAYKFMGAGPGLGLTIARGVIESHGGKVWAESSGHNMESCPGSTFYVLLPIRPPEDSRRIAIEDGATHRSPTPTPRRRAIS